MSVDLPDELQELVEQCNSEDSVDRFEAFEELWDHALNQGTPGEHSAAIFSVMLEWIAREHPDWADILEGLYGCALDLTTGPTRHRYPDENARRVKALDVIRGGHTIFESVLGRQCVLTPKGICQTHFLAGDLLRMAIPHRTGWVAAAMIKLIRKQSPTHSNLWEILDRPSALDDLPTEDLHLCTDQSDVEAVRRSALFHLVSRGDQTGIDRLRAMLPKVQEPSVEEAAIAVRRPGNVPIDILTDLYAKARDLRAVHDLAGGVLRKVAEDERAGWGLVMERRADGKLFVRHPDVGPLSDPNPTEEVVRYRDDLLRKSDLYLVDTDMWELFGLERP